MPSYDYRCEANGRVVEVRHTMSEKLTTWGEVCAQAGLDLDGKDIDTDFAPALGAGGD